MDLGNLKIKRLSDILAELVDYTGTHTDEITDFTTGSVVRSIYEAISMVIEQLYQLSTENVTWAIDHAILDAFDYSPRDAQRAYGYVTVDLYTPLTQDVTLGRGTSFFSSEDGNKTLYFETIEPYLIPQGSTSFKVEVYCTQAGEIGNIPPNYIDNITTTQLSVTGVTNDEAFLTGRDEETAEELKKRFRSFVNTRARATKNAVEYAVNSVPEVTGCYIKVGTGEFTIYAHDANGDLPDSLYNNIIDAVKDKYNPVGTEWHVSPLTKVKVSLQVNLAVTDVSYVTDTFTESLRNYISDYLNHFNADDDLIATEVAQKVLGYSGIIKDVQFVGGATYTTSAEEIIRAGNIYISISDKPNFNGANEIPADGIDDDTDGTDDSNETPEDDTNKGTKLLGFTYYNYSNNYSRTGSPSEIVSITYYDEYHSIITTLPYGITIDVNAKNLKIDGTTYTTYNEQNIPIISLSYDNYGSTYTVYDIDGKVKTQTRYDNYGRVTQLA